MWMGDSNSCQATKWTVASPLCVSTLQWPGDGVVDSLQGGLRSSGARSSGARSGERDG